jgi:hypothetical protein
MPEISRYLRIAIAILCRDDCGIRMERVAFANAPARITVACAT